MGLRIYRCARCGKGIDASEHGRFNCEYCSGKVWGVAKKLTWEESRAVFNEAGIFFYNNSERFYRKWYADFLTWYAKRHNIGWTNKEQ